MGLTWELVINSKRRIWNAFVRIIVLSFCVGISSADAKTIYQTKSDFVNEAFSHTPPRPNTIWLTRQYSPTVKKILGHSYKSKRIKYWRNSAKSVWILEEIGKEKPITLGIIINNKKIQKLRVLIFREKRGEEVRHPFFTRQFIDIELTSDYQLNRYIDGISGATLSVNALGKLARMALYLDKVINEQHQK